MVLTPCCGSSPCGGTSPPWGSTPPCGPLPLWAPVAATTTHASGSLTTLWRLKSPQETFISTKIHLLIQIQPHQICTFEQKAKGNSGHQHNNPPGTLSFGPGMAPNTSDKILCLQKFSPAALARWKTVKSANLNNKTSKAANQPQVNFIITARFKVAPEDLAGNFHSSGSSSDDGCHLGASPPQALDETLNCSRTITLVIT